MRTPYASVVIACLMTLSTALAQSAPASAPASWWTPQAGVAKGQVKEYTIQSTKYGHLRKLAIYTPPGYSGSGKPYDVAYFFDGSDYIDDMALPTVLDNLISAKKVPPLVVVLVDNSEDRLGDLANHTKFADFMAKEVVPWVRKNANITADARHTIVGGYSAGGLASAYVAFMHPGVFGNVLSQSGAFWRGNEGTSEPYEWLTSQYASAAKRELRFYLEVGAGETHRALGSGPVFVETVRRMRDTLKSKGYVVTYKEVPGAKHEPTHWRAELRPALMELTAGW